MAKKSKKSSKKKRAGAATRKSAKKKTVKKATRKTGGGESGGAGKAVKKATRGKTSRTPSTTKAAPRKRTTKRTPKRTTASSRGRSRATTEIEALVELMDRHELVEIEYVVGADGTREIRLSRAAGFGAMAAVPAGQPGPAPAAAAAPAPSASADASGAAAAPPAGEDADTTRFESPMVGTFYRAASPEAAPFVNVGDRLKAGSTICIIEAMKVMNEIKLDVTAEVVSIEVENGEAVEFGQTLFLLRRV